MSGVDKAALVALLDDLKALHVQRVLNVHEGTHHTAQKRTLFTGCSCGWSSGPVMVPDDYDTTVPLRCPTTARIAVFEREQKDTAMREPNNTAPYPFACCDHCDCPPEDRTGHDDTCRFGCNDQPTATPSVACLECGHDNPHPLPTEWDEGGCTFMYANTARGRGIGGSAITACGCHATRARQEDT